MMLYILYRIGVFLALALPVRVSYPLASILADIFYYSSEKDRNAVICNMRIVLGPSADNKVVEATAKAVFRNFAKYLIDFFRFSKLDKDYLNSHVEMEGINNFDDALSMGKGAIALSAHIGNWELGGAIVGLLGYPISGVVLTHKNKRINDFFTNQRMLGNMHPIEMGAALKGCYRALRNNELLALLGDRDFSKNGINIEFFGKNTMMPKGPATLSHRLGAPIVPVFVVRLPDERFKIYVEKPFLCTPGLDEEAAIKELTVKCLRSIESCIRKYPSQWFVFRKIWDIDAKEYMRPDTIV